MLAKFLFSTVDEWRRTGHDDLAILAHFLDLNDGSLECPEFRESPKEAIVQYCECIRKRILPRVVLDLVASTGSHAQVELLKNFFSILIDQPAKRDALRLQFEEVMGTELLKIDRGLGKDWKEALWKTGAWLDIPSVPKFENIRFLVGNANDARPLSAYFPIEYWIQAYEAHRYHVRVFAFSAFHGKVLQAARHACRQVRRIESDEFYALAERKRV